MTRSFGILALAAVICLALHSAGQAQCVNSATPSCAVYSTCFARYCNCAGSPDEYFLTYGAKYCEAFIGRSDFSAAGVIWRDKTLLCLQEKIVPALDISDTPTCDCSRMRELAFQTHVQCYTADPSFCNLPVDDLARVLDTIDASDAFSSRLSIAQIRDLLQACVPTFSTRGIDAVVTKTKALLDRIGSILSN
jgi:hypothetical protein